MMAKTKRSLYSKIGTAEQSTFMSAEDTHPGAPGDGVREICCNLRGMCDK